SSLYGYFNYGQVRSFLTNAAASNPSNTVLASAARYLPANAPSGPAQYAIPSSEMKALGLISGSNGALDGSIGFAGNASGYDFDPRNGINAGSYDFQAVAAHELGEVLGRISGLGASTYRTPLDLFRYSAPGVLSYDYNSPAYFSIDGGQTNGGNFNYSASGGDRGDLAGGSSDIQNAFVSTGQNLNLTAGDLAMLDALGWGGANLGGSTWYAPDTVAFNLIDGAPDFNVPEPGSLALLAAGVAGLLFRRRRSA
ncbi:MAG TPA: NF038122 family metalloprotease, partial [Acetobacteraceae bacterium]